MIRVIVVSDAIADGAVTVSARSRTRLSCTEARTGALDRTNLRCTPLFSKIRLTIISPHSIFVLMLRGFLRGPPG